jgi:hypothetical protein
LSRCQAAYRCELFHLGGQGGFPLRLLCTDLLPPPFFL